jgi:hypothetical protein
MKTFNRNEIENKHGQFIAYWCKKYIKYNGTGTHGEREDFKAFIEGSDEFKELSKQIR